MIEGLWGLRYEDYEADPFYWMERGVRPPQWAEEFSNKGFHGICAADFYEAIFRDYLEPHREKEDYRVGEYGAILLELTEEPISVAEKKRLQRVNRERKKENKPAVRMTRHEDENGKWQDYQIHPRRSIITDDLGKLRSRVNNSQGFCLMAPVAFAGRARSDKNARYMFALALEIDGIDPKRGIDNLVYFWERENRPLPKPTYIVCSGNGVHLYYVFRQPVPLFGRILEQLGKAKHYLTEHFWVKSITTEYEKIQYEAVCQGFRVVGTKAKDQSAVAMAFEIGEEVTLEYLNGFLPKDSRVDVVYKSDLPRKKAMELYPKWYQRRIVEGKEKGHFTKHRAVYDAWKQRIYEEAKVSHRYYCLENLCSLAVQCNIPPEEIEKDCRELRDWLETLTVKEDNHFTEVDVLDALYTYEEGKDKYETWARRLEYISARTGIPLPRNKRNGRPQKDHLALARDRMVSMKRHGIEMKGEVGRPTKEAEIKEYLRLHPEATPTEISKAIGVSRTTVYKYINEPNEKQRKETMLRQLAHLEEQLNEALAQKDYVTVQQLAGEVAKLKRLTEYAKLLKE